MIKKLTIIAAITFVSSSFTLIDNTSATIDSKIVVDGPNWEKFKCEVTGAKVKFPATPKTETSTEDGTTNSRSMCTYEGSSIMYNVTHHDDLAGVEPMDLAKVSLEAFTESINGEISSQSDWKVKKSTGLQAIMEISEHGAKVDYRVVIIGNNQYQLVTIEMESDPLGQDIKDTFFDSFKPGK